MIHEKSADTKILESVLASAEIGQTITYEELSKAIGRDVRKFSVSALFSARRCVFNEHRMVFGVVRNVGLKRLDDKGIVNTSESDRMRLQRISNKSLRKLSVVKFEDLPQEAKRQHVVASAQFGAIAMFSSKSSTKKIEQRVNESTAVLPIGETLKLFS